MNQPAIEDRGIPTLKASSGTSKKLKLLAAGSLFLVLACGIGFLVFKKVMTTRAAEKTEQAEEGRGSNTSDVHDTDVKDVPDFVKEARNNPPPGSTPDEATDAASPDAAAPAASSATSVASQNGVGSQNGNDGENPQKPTPEEDARARRQHAPVLAYEETGVVAAPGHAAGAQATADDAQDPYEAAMLAALNSAGGNAAQQQPAGGGQRLSEQLKADRYEPASATMGAAPSFMVPQGTIARCVLRTGFNSQLAGFASCMLSEPIYSADGRFVMAERGSVVSGDYQTGQVKPGVTRAFVLWTRIRTPNGITLNVDSPATDGMGQSGITGKVRNHFWQRFGSALLLSMVDDAVAATSNNNRYQNTSNAANDAAAIAVENSVNIPPTITAKAGSVVNIYFARDLDFSTVYSARLSNTKSTKP